MKAARFHAPGDIRLEDVPEPVAGPGDVVIRVRNCSTCGTDVKISRHGHQNIVPPRTMGHEIAGEIVEIGSEVASQVERWKVGDRVGVGWHGGHCGYCSSCRRGDFVTCRVNAQIPGISYDGGHADYMIAPAVALARIPDGLSAAEAGP